MISALCSVLDTDVPEEVDRILDEGVPDPAGSFYRFSLAGSQLRRRRIINGADRNPAPERDPARERS
jgi:hypothetical protein